MATDVDVDVGVAEDVGLDVATDEVVVGVPEDTSDEVGEVEAVDVVVGVPLGELAAF